MSYLALPQIVAAPVVCSLEASVPREWLCNMLLHCEKRDKLVHSMQCASVWTRQCWHGLMKGVYLHFSPNLRSPLLRQHITDGKSAICRYKLFGLAHSAMWSSTAVPWIYQKCREFKWFEAPFLFETTSRLINVLSPLWVSLKPSGERRSAFPVDRNESAVRDFELARPSAPSCSRLKLLMKWRSFVGKRCGLRLTGASKKDASSLFWEALRDLIAKKCATVGDFKARGWQTYTTAQHPVIRTYYEIEFKLCILVSMQLIHFWMRKLLKASEQS